MQILIQNFSLSLSGIEVPLLQKGVTAKKGNLVCLKIGEKGY